MLTGRRAAAGAVLVALLGGCSAPSSATEPSPPATPNVALSKAADLRTHLDLLLAEHVMIVAKESAAAINHADEYAAYASLLHANAADLSTLLTRAVGATDARQLTNLWSEQNSFLVDYAIGAASHDDARSKQAAAGLTTSFVPAYAQVVASAAGAPADASSALLAQQVAMDRAFIDDYAAQRFPKFYADLGTAYAHTSQLGDQIATGVVRMYPDKFPGDAGAAQVDSRVRLNLLLQQDEYLATMATGAKVAARTAETAAAMPALATSAMALRIAFAGTKGRDAAAEFANLWSMRDAALTRYAAGDRTASGTLTSNVAPQLATLTDAPAASVRDQAAGMLKVIDDQLAKSTDSVADDDRAAATAMQPIADAIVA